MSVLQAHGLYDNYLKVYLKFTSKYFEEESQKKAEALKDKPLLFFQHLSNRLEDEMGRMETDFPAGSWAEIRNTVESALMKNRFEWLAKGGEYACCLPDRPY